jgi:hypothetical protein
MEAKGIVLKTRCDDRWGWNKYGREGVSTKNVLVALGEGSDMWHGGNLGVESC